MAAGSASYLDNIFLGDFDDVHLDDLGVRSEDGLVKPHDAAKLWQPKFLRRRVLTGFLLFYLALILALAALFRFSESHQGIVTALQRNYLLWQYGPTAVFTLIGAFWGQVEYRAKQFAPWKLMAQGPQPAERSLLLDFVSPASLVSLYKSLKIPGTRFVAVAITGGIVIELITVLSTGIFLLQPVPVDHLHLTNALDDFGGVNSTVFDPAKVDGRAATRVYAIRYNHAPYPSGTSPDYAFQNVITTNAPPDATTMTVNVNIFHPDISCEPLVVESIQTKLLTSHGTYEPLHYRLWSENDGMFTITTEVNRKSPAPFGGMYPVVNEPYFVAHVGVSDNANTDSSSLLSSKVSGVLCKAGYGISSGVIRIDLGTSHISVVDVTNTSDARPSQLPGVSAENLLLAVSDQLDVTNTPLYIELLGHDQPPG